MNCPPLGPNIPRRGHAGTRFLGQALLTLAGWHFEGSVPDVPRLVAIAAPHTSNWDFLLGMAVLFALGVRVTWMGKHTLFRGPWAGLVRWLGGMPVKRDEPRGVVAAAAAALKARDKAILALAPEGTRRRVQKWRTGFYYIALEAGVPILPVALDYGRKVVAFGPPLLPSGDLEADLVPIQAFYRQVAGKHPQNV